MEIEEIKRSLRKIIERYDKHKDDKSFMGNEKQACQSLIVPLIRDVLHWQTEDPSEFKAEESRGGKRIDYVVYNQGISQFIVEAKAPNKEIFDNDEYYKQTLEYGYSKDHNFAVLTNFRQIVILACKINVRVARESEVGRIDLTTASDTELNTFLLFEKNYWISSGKNNLLFARLGTHKTSIAIDKQLLEDMKHWRELLLTNIQKNAGSKLDFNDEQEFMQVEEEVQKFIDRLIFICFCEDKELSEPQLKSLIKDKIDRFALKSGFLLSKIQEVFANYRRVYDSDLFDKSLCDSFLIDDAKLLDILTELREPKGRIAYDFKSIEADILGRAYENFIGHIQTGKKRFKEKEDIGKRKKEGIYYTPKYIVDYIVNNTVRELAKGKKFEEINKVRILDPACGSGSFLLRAFDILIEESIRALARELTYEEKKTLMINCIYGVDLDERAVAIAKLNLSLKLAEKDKLPMLGDNIRLGNSIIDDKTVAGYKAFVWKDEFKEIMQNGGFDVVIGNPPYVDIKQLDQKIVRYFFDKYSTVENRMNLYAVFVEKALSLLKDGGYFGFIIPNSILYNESYQKIRALLLDKVTLRKIIRLPDNIFQNVKVETIILIYQKEKETTKKPNCEVLIYPREATINTINKENNVQVADFNQKIWETENNVINISTNTSLIKLLNKIEEETKPLIDICDFSLGLTPYDKYTGHTKSQIEERVFHSKTKKNATFKPLLSGENIIRYGIFWDGKEYLSYGNWLGAPREQRFFTKPRIVVRQIVSGKPPRIYAGYTEEEFYNTQIAFNLLGKDETKISLKYLLSILNSKLINFYHKEKYLDQSKNLFQKILIVNAKKFPIKIISLEKQQPLIKLVDKMLSLNKLLNEIGDKKTSEIAKLQEEIKKTDIEIDELVYNIYSITTGEKKIIEESLSNQ